MRLLKYALPAMTGKSRLSAATRAAAPVDVESLAVITAVDIDNRRISEAAPAYEVVRSSIYTLLDRGGSRTTTICI